VLYLPQKDQVGWPAASPSGRHVAIVEAVCSDRWIVAGDLLLIDTRDGAVTRIETNGVDVSCADWRSDERIAYAGHRGLESVLGVYNLTARAAQEHWASRDPGSGGRYLRAAWFGAGGDCVFCSEGFQHGQEIAVVQGRKYRAIKSLGNGGNGPILAPPRVEVVRWRAPDGLMLEGWLMRPEQRGPHPLVMEVHGGPVSQWRSRWLGRDNLHTLMLLRHGYAVFWPNPRGSGGYGREFARRVQGDMGGMDMQDLLSGVDSLLASGVADPKRLGVMGRSYGGFMTCWLVTQDKRFAAAVALAPATNHVSQYLTCSIPQFISLFLADDYANCAGRFLSRSPVVHARKGSTPTLNVCGALDRCMPPEQAIEFHNALLANGVESMLVSYPQEGHGNRQLQAVADYAARVVGWFEKHMPARGGQ
jgi:dipeptidyl aminopeptidase/acylaminoacyl peptidase